MSSAPPTPDTVDRPACAVDAGFLRQTLQVARNGREDPDVDRSLLQQPQVAHDLTGRPADTDVGVTAEAGTRAAGAVLDGPS